MSITERLQLFIQESGTNINQVTVRAGLKAGTLNKALAVAGQLRSDTVAAILQAYPELSADWLLLGYGPMRRRYPRSPDMDQSRHEELSLAADPPTAYGAMLKATELQRKMELLLSPEHIQLLEELIEERKRKR
jgi:hypothetical protein